MVTKQTASLRKYTGLTRSAVLLVVFLLALFFSLPGQETAVSQAAPKAQPALLELAATQPEATVRVIAQKTTTEADITQFVTRLGGEIVHDLRLINAWAIRLPVENVVALATHPAVSWVSPDGGVISAGKPPKDGPTIAEPNYFLETLNVQPVWDMGLQGQGVAVAVIDSGIASDNDFETDPAAPNSPSRILFSESFNPNSISNGDKYGHGTHVAGIIGGNGADSGGAYAGIAPLVDLISLKVSDDEGNAHESDVVAALEWVFNNHAAYNIRVVNISINSSAESSFNDSPMTAAAEILWLNGIVVVVSAGNEIDNFNTVKAAPANDPYVITVGASDEYDNAHRPLDWITNFSAHGTTIDGYEKPEVIAPGKDIISVLADTDWADIGDRTYLGEQYFRLSGTSMSAPMVSGAVALLLQDEPHLTPDQVKYRLMNTGSVIYGTGGGANVGYPYLDVYDLITSDDVLGSANQDVVPHQLLAKMAMIAYWASQNGNENIDWANVDWDAVDWDNVNWDSVNWNSVNWNSVNWNSVNWNSVNWNSVNWNSVNWNSVNWNSVNWNSVNWNSVNWNSVNWNSVSWDN